MKKNLLKILGIVILIFILRKVNLQLVWEKIENCNLFLLSIAVLAEVGCLFTKSIRWKWILKILQIKANFWDSLRAYWAGLYFAAVTPGRVGDISRAYFLGKSNPSVGRSIFSVILDRLIDILSLLLLGLLASYFYLKELSQLNQLLLLSLAVLGLCIWIVFLKRNFLYRLFKKLIYKFVSQDKLPLRENLDFSILKGAKKRDYLLISGYVLAGWIVYFSGWWFLAKAFYIEITFAQMVGVVSIAAIISLIPITVGGLGTRDATIIIILSQLGIAREFALSFSLLIFAIEIVIMSTGVFFFYRSLKYKKV